MTRCVSGQITGAKVKLMTDININTHVFMNTFCSDSEWYDDNSSKKEFKRRCDGVGVVKGIEGKTVYVSHPHGIAIYHIDELLEQPSLFT